jgi:hypothetical protein
MRRCLKDAGEDMQLNEGGKRRTCIRNSKSETSEPYERIFDGGEDIAGCEEEISVLGEKNCWGGGLRKSGDGRIINPSYD